MGDCRPFIAALLVPEQARIAAELEREESSVGSGELAAMLWSRVEKINERLEEFEKIRKIAILERDFPERVRSVTAFQKIKVDRKEVEELYRGEISRIYGSE